MGAAAKQLTPVTLELGGKSPCIVDQTADLTFAVRNVLLGQKRLMQDKFVSPRIIFMSMLHAKKHFVNKLKEFIQHFYGEDPEKSTSYGRIINKKHFARLIRICMQKGKVLLGGKTNAETLYISPTLIDGILGRSYHARRNFWSTVTHLNL